MAEKLTKKTGSFTKNLLRTTYNRYHFTTRYVEISMYTFLEENHL